MQVKVVRQITLSLDNEEWNTVLNGLSKLSNNSDYEVSPEMQRMAGMMHDEIVRALETNNNY